MRCHVRTEASRAESNARTRTRFWGGRQAGNWTSDPQLQRKCACGGGCPVCAGSPLTPMTMKSSSRVGAPNDRFEQEAEHVADDVMPMPAGQVQASEKRRLQLKAAGPTEAAASDVPENADEVTSSAGQPLDLGTRELRKCASDIIPGVVSVSRFALQLASDPAPPPEFALLDQEEEFVPEAGGGPIDDVGEPVAELEEGTVTSDSEDRGDEEEYPIQTQLSPVAPAAKAPVEGVVSQLGPGQPLGPQVQQRMELFFGYDFGRVRVHADDRSDSLARALGAQAFAVGDQVAFAANRYRPESSQGARLLVHELSHVVQQSSGLDANLLQKGIGSPGDRYEQEADSNADRFARGETRAQGVASVGDLKDASILPSFTVQLYSGSDAATYARTWALSTNPNYPRFDNDCTNFVSQSTLAGGWGMLGGSCADRKESSAWWYGSWKCWYPGVRASYTWAGAQNFHDFTSTSGRGRSAPKVSDLDIGDVLQMKFPGATNVGHTMIVTDKKDSNLLLSYHTGDHLDEPFWGPGGIFERNREATYYGWKL